MWYRAAADAIVVLHAGYVVFVLAGLGAIVIGMIFRWRWVRNFWFRALHLTAILVVVAEAWCGITCPLTTWEKWLRQQAGQTAYQGDFLARWVHDTLFFTAPPWVFTLAYTLFGLGVLATFLLAPPRWPWRAPPATIPPPPDR